MPACRFCKCEIPADAVRCPHCTSFQNENVEPAAPGQVTYVVDKGLVTFAKFAGTVLAIFLAIGAAFYGLDLKQTQKQIDETYQASQKLDLNIKGAQVELDKQKLDLKKAVDEMNASAASARKSAAEANEAFSKLAAIEKKAEEQGHAIEGYQVQAVLAVKNIGDISRSPTTSTQLEHLVEAKLLESMRDIIPPNQFAALEARIKAKKNLGFRRRIYDAKNGQTRPGQLVRAEGDAAVADPAVNQVYDHLGTVHEFFNQVFDKEIADYTGGSLTATVHFGKQYNNGFWDGQQIVIGDGDGVVFKAGAFYSLWLVAVQLFHAVTDKVAHLTYAGEPGALNSSFSDVFSNVIEQWEKKQTVDDASWVVMADAFVASGKSGALRSLKAPGTAFPDDQQIATIAKIYRGDSDNRGVHINSGIPNKVFYEVSRRVGGYAWEKPARIWWEALANLNPDSSLTISLRRLYPPAAGSTALKARRKRG